MPIRPEIALQVQRPKIPSAAEVLTLKNLATQGQLQDVQLQQAQLQQQNMMRLRDIYGQAGSIDPTTGLPTPETMPQIGAIDPTMVPKLVQQRAAIEQSQAATAASRSATAVHQADLVARKEDTLNRLVRGPALAAYNAALPQGQEAAMRAGQMAYSEGLDSAGKTGLFSVQERGTQFPLQFDPERAQRNLMQSKDWIASQNTMNAPVSDIGKLNKDYNRGLISKADYDAEIKKKTSPNSFTLYGEKGKPPAGYQWSETNPNQLEPVPGGPNDIKKNVEETAQAIANYDYAPLKGFVLKSLFGQEVMKRVREINPEYSEPVYNRKNKAMADMGGSGRTASLTRSFNVFIQHSDVMRQAATALDNGDIQLFNKVGQMVSQQTGNPAPTNFDAIKKIYGDELVKAIVGTGGSQSDRQEASLAVTRAQSPKQLMGIMDSYDRLMAGQVMGVRQQYESATGRKDYEDFLLPHTKEVLKKYGYASTGSAQSQAPKPGAVMDGYRFKGGDPSKQENWEKQ